MIYHLCKSEDWLRSIERGSHRAASLDSEGFIHCSTEEQVKGSATKHFQDSDELTILAISPKKVKDILKYETSRGGKLFPHLYGEIPLHIIETTHMLIRNAKGEWEWDWE